MPSSIYCTTAALWIAITTLTTFYFKSAFFFPIFNKYVRALKIWGTLPFFFSESSWNLKLKTCHLLHFMHWHGQKSVCRSNVLTGVKWLPRDFRWHALTSMQNRASQLSMYWGQCLACAVSFFDRIKETAHVRKTMKNSCVVSMNSA